MKKRMNDNKNGRKTYTLIFMDIQMPVMNGYEACKQIRQLESQINEKACIVGLTAHSTDKFKDKCFESGMDEFSKYSICLHL